MSQDLTDAELAEIETRASFATGGPWTANHEFLTVCTDDTRSLVNVLLDAPDSRSHHPRASADADFIAHARTDVPRLVAALRAAREDLAVHHADEAAVSTLLAAALGDRFSPDGPLADAVGLLVGERDQARTELAKTADDMDMYAEALDSERKYNAKMDRRLDEAEAQVRSLRTYVDELIAEREEARAALARAERATADARCGSCDHDISIHQKDGCWFTVSLGRPGQGLVCPCVVPRDDDARALGGGHG